MRVLAWLKEAIGEERAQRQLNPGLVAFYWDGGRPEKHQVRDISLTGAYIYAKKPWCVGTLLMVTFQREGRAKGNAASGSVISILCKLVRDDGNGIGLRFMLYSEEKRETFNQFFSNVMVERGPYKGPYLVRHREDREAPPVTRKKGRGTSGQALIEYALMVPLLFLLIANTVNFGGFLYSWITIANASRVGSQDAAMGAAYETYPTVATLSAFRALITAETAALPNASGSNPTVTICQNLNGVAVVFPLTTPPVACSLPAGVSAPPTDPETITGSAGASPYTTVAVDVTYTYTPFIGSGLQFPALNIFMAGMPASVHRRTVMRVLN